MIALSLTFRGLDEIQREADRRIDLLHEGIERDLDWFGKAATEEMVETHTFQNRTFRLEGSIDYDLYRFDPFGLDAHVALFALAPYASQVEFGHPGPPPARPYPFFYPVLYNRVGELWERQQRTVKGALEQGELP